MEKQKNIIVRSIPNTLTSLNIFSGCIAIVMAFNGNLVWAAYFIWFGAFFDFFDGMAARLLKAYSPLGKELDSLADMVSFGIAPSVIIYTVMNNNINNGFSMINTCTDPYLIYISFLIAVFSGLRLAKFNIDTRQSESFIGLPTPANAIFFSSLPLILTYYPEFELEFLLRNNYFLIGTTLLFSLLLVSEIPMFSLKFKNMNIGNNKLRFGFLILSLALLIIFQLAALPVIILIYILLSIFVWITKTQNK